MKGMLGSLRDKDRFLASKHSTLLSCVEHQTATWETAAMIEAVIAAFAGLTVLGRSAQWRLRGSDRKGKIAPRRGDQ